MTPRMRTLAEAAKEIKEIDPSTALTHYAIRKLVLEGRIPHFQAGAKRLINLDTLLTFLVNPEAFPIPIYTGQIRPIDERYKKEAII